MAKGNDGNLLQHAVESELGFRLFDRGGRKGLYVILTHGTAVLIAVQGGMLAAGGLVGLVYERAGLAGILSIDGTTYAISALCFYLLRRGYFAPRGSASRALFGAAGLRAQNSVDPRAEPEPEPGVLADIHEGLNYLRCQPAVLALGLTYACMMAGVISANVLVVALANNLLHVGARGYGFIESGWALGAVLGGFGAAPLSHRRPFRVLVGALFVLAIGHALFPYAGSLAIAIVMNAVFGACRAIGAVLTQSSILASVPNRLMGRTQFGLCLLGHCPASAHEFRAGMVGRARQPATRLPSARRALRRSGSFRLACSHAHSASRDRTDHRLAALRGRAGRAIRSGPRFVDQVEGRLGGSPETSETCRGYHFSDARLAGLRAKTQSHFLGARAGRAQQRRKRVVNAAHGIQVVLDVVICKWLDDHPAAISLQRLANVFGRPHRVSHIVQAVEYRHEIVVFAGVRLRRRHLERHPLGDALTLGGFARSSIDFS